jgi:septum formation protein
MRPLLLASTSRWRRKLLEDAGISVACEAPGVDERAVQIADPVRLARELAARKADVVGGRYPGRWVLGADQVAHLDGEIFGKPEDPDDHRARLRSLRGRAHELVTGWALRGPGEPLTAHVTTRMLMRDDVSDAEIDAYVASGEADGCAGGYAIEGRGAFLFRQVDGDWFNVVGLPVLDVWTALRARGWRFGEAG